MNLGEDLRAERTCFTGVGRANLSSFLPPGKHEKYRKVQWDDGASPAGYTNGGSVPEVDIELALKGWSVRSGT